MKNFFSSVKFKVIACIVALLLGFMIQAAYTGNLSSIASKALGFVTAPFQSIATGVSNTVGGFFDKLQDSEKLMDEIESLKKENRQLQRDLVDFNRYKEQNETYQQMLQIKEANPSYQMVPCDVVGRDPAERYYSFTINKGSNDGIGLKNVVMTDAGMVGIIIDVGPNYAKVMTILDPGLSIGCYSTQSRDTGILSGDTTMISQGQTKLHYISSASTMAADDYILTSGGKSGLYPRDIMVGKVTKVKTESHGISRYAQIQPAVDVTRVSTVIVITSFEN